MLPRERPRRRVPDRAVAGNNEGDMTGSADAGSTQRKREEWRSFVFLAVIMVPVLTGLLIASYGFLIWFSQMFLGPPGS